jgi:hypothetical protein
MKRLLMFVLLIILVFVFGEFLSADLLEVYKKGELQLIADREFGKNVDWNTLFFDHDLKANFNDKSIGLIKRLGFADDGSIFVSNYSQFNVFKFDANGNFIKRMAEKGRKTGPNSPINRRPDAISVLDNKYVVISEYQGRIGVYDLEGNPVKLIKIDYCIVDCVALKDSKIAILGSVAMGNGKSKMLIAVKDIQTEKENHITFFMENPSENTISVQKDIYTISFGGPFDRLSTFIRRTRKGNLLVGRANSPKITVYSPEGRTVTSFDLTITPIEITEKDKQEYIEGLKKSVKKLELSEETILGAMRAKPNFFPPVTPLYYQMMVDSEDNLLVFIYTTDKERHVFQVYSPEGRYVCNTVLNPGDYSLQLNPHLNTMGFLNGDLYGLFQLKTGMDAPLRLIRVKLTDR